MIGDAAKVDPSTAKDVITVSDDSIIHWLLGGMVTIATAFSGILGFTTRSALDRLKNVEDGKVDKDDHNRAIDELGKQLSKVDTNTTKILLLLAGKNHNINSTEGE